MGAGSYFFTTYFHIIYDVIRRFRPDQYKRGQGISDTFKYLFSSLGFLRASAQWLSLYNTRVRLPCDLCPVCHHGMGYVEKK